MIEEKNKKKKVIIIVSVIVVSIAILIGIFSLFFIPRIKLNGSNNVKIKLNEEYHEKGVIATYSFKDVSDKVTINGTVNNMKVGKYVLKYTYDKGLIKQTVTRVVEVIDDVSPIIELKGNESSIVCPNKEYQEEGYTAIDNYDGDITDKVIIENGDNLINYKVKDSSNNETVVTRNIVKEDKTKPTIKLNGASLIYILLNSSFKDPSVTVSDNCDDNNTLKVETTGTVNTKKTGTYNLSYSVTDSSGNKATITRSVIVYSSASRSSSTGKKGVIYLTFDDGPSSSITPGVLKILKQKNVKATFFVINHGSNLDYLIKQEFNEGHTVALHSYTHDYKTIYSSKDAYFKDLQKISDKVKNLTGVDSKIIRFPGGSSNTVSRNYSKGIMSYLTNEVINRGYHYFDWNVSSGDAGDVNTKEAVYRSVINGLSKSRANVVLMHDFDGNYKTLNALSDIIDYGINNGYTFEKIDINTPLVIHNVNN